MKKTVKPIILLVVLIMLLSTLTGCKELDNLRSTHAVWTEKGVYDSITLNGVEYKRINIENAPSVFKTKPDIIYLTDPDVPVLLASSMSETFDISEDENFIFGYIIDPSYTDGYTSDRLSDTFISGYNEQGPSEYSLFCKADIYEDVMKKIESGIEYTDYVYEYVDPDTRMLNNYFLKDEENKAFKKVLEEVKPIEENQSDYGIYMSVMIENVSDDHYFSNNFYDISWNLDEDQYIISYYSEATRTWYTYEVPKEMNDTFDKITEKAKLESELDYEITEEYYEY